MERFAAQRRPFAKGKLPPEPAKPATSGFLPLTDTPDKKPKLKVQRRAPFEISLKLSPSNRNFRSSFRSHIRTFFFEVFQEEVIFEGKHLRIFAAGSSRIGGEMNSKSKV